MKLGLKRAELYAQLCHTQNYIAAVMPAPVVNRISWGEGFCSRRQTDSVPSKGDYLCKNPKPISLVDCCFGLVSFQREILGGKITKVICPVVLG